MSAFILNMMIVVTAFGAAALLLARFDGKRNIRCATCLALVRNSGKESLR